MSIELNNTERLTRVNHQHTNRTASIIRAVVTLILELLLVTFAIPLMFVALLCVPVGIVIMYLLFGYWAGEEIVTKILKTYSDARDTIRSTDSND